MSKQQRIRRFERQAVYGVAGAILAGVTIATGALTGSVALLALGVQIAVGPAAAIIAWLAGRAAARPADEEHVFGHGKLGDAVTLSVGIAVLALAGFIVAASVRHLQDSAPVLYPVAGLVLAALAGLMEYLFLRYLHQRGYGRRWPIAEEVWQPTAGLASAVVVLAGLLAQSLLPLSPIDPVLAIFVALIIAASGLHLVRRSLQQLLDVSLPAAELATIRACLERHGGEIVGYTELRTRRSGVERYVNLDLTLPRHLSIEQAHQLCERIEDEIGVALGNCLAIIHCEPCSWDEKTPCPGDNCRAAESCARLTGQGARPA